MIDDIYDDLDKAHKKISKLQFKVKELENHIDITETLVYNIGNKIKKLENKMNYMMRDHMIREH